MPYTLVTVPFTDIDFRKEENWSRLETDTRLNSIHFTNLLKYRFKALAYTITPVYSETLNKARLPGGTKLETINKASIEKGLAAFEDASEALRFVRAYLSDCQGINVPEITQIREEFQPDDWRPD